MMSTPQPETSPQHGASSQDGASSRHRTSAGRRTIVIRGPKDAVTAVPCLLGFHPQRSLVAIGIDGPHGTCAVRMDLPPPADGGPPERGAETDAEVDATAGHLAGVLSANGFGTTLLIGYGPESLVAPMVEAARTALACAAVEVIEALRVDDDRFWSYLCDDPSCCPAEGTRFDFRDSAAAADTVLQGQVVLSDRAELALTVAPLAGSARAAMRRATDRAERRVLEWVERGLRPEAVRDRMEAEGLSLVRSLAERVGGSDPWPAGGGPADDEVAWLGLLLTHLRVRDEAWVRIDATNIAVHVDFWRTILRRVDPAHAAAPGALLGYAAYLAGDGGLANVALDRAEAARPGYSMAGLIRDLMMAGVPPAKAVLPMTPEALSEAYDQERREAG